MKKHSNGVKSKAQDLLAKDSMTNDFYLRFDVFNSPRSQKTQLARDMYIFILYTISEKNSRKFSSIIEYNSIISRIQIVGH